MGRHISSLISSLVMKIMNYVSFNTLSCKISFWKICNQVEGIDRSMFLLLATDIIYFLSLLMLHFSLGFFFPPSILECSNNNINCFLLFFNNKINTVEILFFIDGIRHHIIPINIISNFCYFRINGYITTGMMFKREGNNVTNRKKR